MSLNYQCHMVSSSMLRVTIQKCYVNMDSNVRWTAYRLSCPESLLDISGWTGALVQAVDPTHGKPYSFVNPSHITPIRRAHQVKPCVLQQALENAHQEHVKSTESNTEPMSLEDWCTVQQETHPVFKFWFLVLQRQFTIRMFVRSIRAANFPLYIQSLTKLVHGFSLLTITTMYCGYQFTSAI